MGNLIWHEWARYVSLTASLYTIWAAYFALLWRKFFWDFVSGIQRNPGGLQPAPGDAFFVSVIVKAPVIPILSIILGGVLVGLEYPAPFLKGTSIQRSLVLRPVLLLIQALIAIFFYQGTNGAIYSLVAAIGYSRALSLGEEMKDAKANKGRGGKA
ncbi:hypothetical protein FA95DRAFT_1533785 [Auriscalpium vulgare]|uniref:Uncharacterized protein n=1 Tax=Auriscalpium vulgare TaxID=40419 RepID=A0ACB8S7F4_9AGAM|nr:hypothetical protein FA95DRAFT_1533785 [Auriscalpium vulgare]